MAWSEEEEILDAMKKGKALTFQTVMASSLGLKEARNDPEKLRFELIPPEANEALAKVLTYGAQKYGQRNWEKGLYHDEIMGALLRHLHEYQKGNLIDTESGLTHLSHAYCNLAFLITMIERRPELSEREE